MHCGPGMWRDDMLIKLKVRFTGMQLKIEKKDNISLCKLWYIISILNKSLNTTLEYHINITVQTHYKAINKIHNFWAVKHLSVGFPIRIMNQSYSSFCRCKCYFLQCKNRNLLTSYYLRFCFWGSKAFNKTIMRSQLKFPFQKHHIRQQFKIILYLSGSHYIGWATWSPNSHVQMEAATIFHNYCYLQYTALFVGLVNCLLFYPQDIIQYFDDIPYNL